MVVYQIYSPPLIDWKYVCHAPIRSPEIKSIKGMNNGLQSPEVWKISELIFFRALKEYACQEGIRWQQFIADFYFIFLIPLRVILK